MAIPSPAVLGEFSEKSLLNAEQLLVHSLAEENCSMGSKRGPEIENRDLSRAFRISDKNSGEQWCGEVAGIDRRRIYFQKRVEIVSVLM